MASEIEPIGLELQTSGIEKGIKKLDELARKGPEVEQAMDGVAQSGKRVLKSLSELGSSSGDGLKRTGDAAKQAATGINASGKAAREAVTDTESLRRSVSALTQSEEKFLRSMVDQVNAMSMTRGEYAAYQAAQKGLSAGAQEAARALGNKIDMLKAEQSQLSGTADIMRQVTSVAKGLFAGVTLGGFTGKLVSVQREFDKLNSSLVTVTGSSANAEAQMAWLKDFAATTPYGLAQATEAFVKMKALGLDPSRAALTSYGNTAAAMGKNLMQMIEAVADASTGEFERLKEFGIKASKEGDNVKLTFQGVTTTVKNNAEEITKYLEKIGDTQFAGAMAERAKTLDGAISELGDTWDELFRTINQQNTGQFIHDSVKLASGAVGDLTTMILAANKAMEDGATKGQSFSVVQDGIAVVFETVLSLAANVQYVLTQVGNEIGGLVAQAVQLAQLNFSGVAAIREAMVADAEAARAAIDRQTDAILNARRVAKEWADYKAQIKGSSLGGIADQVDGFKFETKKPTGSGGKVDKKAIADANRELKEQQKLINEMAGLKPDFMEDWNRLNDMYKKGAISLEVLTEWQGKLLKDQPFMKAQTKEFDEADKAYRKYTDGLFKSAAALDEQTAQQNAANETFGKSKTAIAAMAAEQAKLAALNAKDVGPWTQDGVDGMNAMAKAAEDYAESLMKGVYQQSLLKYDDGIKAAREQLELQQYGMSLLGMEEQKRSKLIAVKQSELKLQKEIRDIEKETYSLDPVENENRKNKLIADARIKAEIELQGQLLQIQDQFVQQQAQKFDDIFRQGFADMVNNGSDGLKAFGKSLKTTVLTSIADGIYQALIKKWVVNIATNLTGGIGGLVGAAGSLLGGSSGSGGGASNLLSLASNANTAYGLYSGTWGASVLGNSFVYGAATPGLTIGSQQAAMLASQTGEFGLYGLTATQSAAGGATTAGMGAMSGAGIGAAIVMAAAYLGGMFKSEKQVGAGLTGELGGDVYGYQLMREGGSLFSGPSYKYIIAEQELAKARAEIEELKKNPELETDGNLTYRMKYLRERVEMLEGKYGSSVDGSQGPIDTLQKTYSAIRETVASQADSLGLDGEAVRQMKTVLGLDEIHPDTGGTGLELFGLSEEEAAAKVQAAMEKANEDLARSVLGSMQEVTREITRTYAEIIPVHDEDGNVYENRIWHDVTETVTSMEWVMSEYVREGETAVAALNRISGSLVGVNQVFEMLGADLLAASIASGDWASKLIEAMGGIDNLNTVAVGYYDRYYSDDEKRARQIAAANKGMEGLGLDLRVEHANAIEDFRALVDKAIAAQDEELLASLLNISGQFGEAVDAVAAAAQAHLGELEEAARAAAEALKNALSKAMRNLEGAIGRDVDGLAAQKSALAEQRSLHNESLSLITGIFDLVASNARDLYGTVDSVAQMQAQQGRAFISDALFAAQRTGYLPEKDALSEAINAARAGIDDGAYSTQFERDADVLKLAGQLSALEEISGKQKTFEELQLDALDSQINAIDKQTKVLQDQLAAAKEALLIAQGEYDATIGTNEALAKFYALIDSYLNPETPEATTTGGYGRPTVGAGSSSGDPIKAGATGKGGYYREVETGYGTTYVVDNSQHLKDVDKWLDQYRGTGDVEGMLRAASGTGDISIGDITSVMGWTKKDLEDIADKYGIPKFDVGTNYVPRDMLAMLHEGEAVVPKADNRALMAALNGGGGAGNAALVAEVRALREEVAALRASADRTAANTDKLPQMADQFDNVTEGGNAMRVEVIA